MCFHLQIYEMRLRITLTFHLLQAKVYKEQCVQGQLKHKKQASETRQTDGYIILLLGYVGTSF